MGKITSSESAKKASGGLEKKTSSSSRSVVICKLLIWSKQVRRSRRVIAPLARDEILYLRSPDRHVSLIDFVTDVMRRKLLRRTKRQKGILSLQDLENIERRAKSAYDELKEAWHFDYVIPNYDGEDSENWNVFYYPVGDARRALLALADLISGKVPTLVEKWEQDLLPYDSPERC